MGKVKLAICIGEEIYQTRLVKCLMNHYKDRYELHIFEEISELEALERKPYHGYVLGEAVAECAGLSEEQKKTALILQEENKYQEVYKLVEALEILLGEHDCKERGETGNYVMGVYSFTLPHMQMPFSAMISSLCGEQSRVILLDFQANSGWKIENTDAQNLGMEDVLAMSMTQTFHKSRFLSAIGRRPSWDYIFPVKSAKGLEEISAELVKRIISFLLQELEYETVILNMGDGILDIGEFMGICDNVYLLYPKGNSGSWREKSYVDELERRGKDDVFNRVHRIEVPSILSTDGEWESLVEKWKWNSAGDYLRKIVWEANSSG